MRKIQFAQPGFNNLLKEREELQRIRKDAVARLQEARNMGDLSENSAYKVARSKLSSIDSRLRRLDFMINNAEIVEKSTNEAVSIGNRVIINDGNADFEYFIVGAYESDLAKSKLSQFSPLGKALMNKKIGDKI